jgi:hypothetical protein
MEESTSKGPRGRCIREQLGNGRDDKVNKKQAERPREETPGGRREGIKVCCPTKLKTFSPMSSEDTIV